MRLKIFLGQRLFQPHLWMGGLALLSISLLISLGLWQLHRAEEKNAMLLHAQLQGKSAATVWQATKALPQQYQLVTVKGSYLNHTFLLDNQSHQHQFGYHVLTPLQIAPGKVVLIDRGWVPLKQPRSILPNSTIPQGEQLIKGQTYYPSAKQWILGDVIEKEQQEITVIERFDEKTISNILHNSVYPFIIRLDKSESYGYIREWPIVAMTPQRHYAYALQWFAMALSVFIIFIVTNLKKIKV